MIPTEFINTVQTLGEALWLMFNQWWLFTYPFTALCLLYPVYEAWKEGRL